jgi:hypothetical protein
MSLRCAMSRMRVSGTEHVNSLLNDGSHGWICRITCREGLLKNISVLQGVSQFNAIKRMVRDKQLIGQKYVETLAIPKV